LRFANCSAGSGREEKEAVLTAITLLVQGMAALTLEKTESSRDDNRDKLNYRFRA